MDFSENKSEITYEQILDKQKLKCTCPRYSITCDRDSAVFGKGKSKLHASVLPSRGYSERSHGRNISLGQIIPLQVCDTEDSSEPKKSLLIREMTDFEKDNLLFLNELKVKRQEQRQFLEKQVLELPYLVFPCKRGNRRHIRAYRNVLNKEAFPITAFYPSQVSSSEILRSVSLEEDEIMSDDSSSDDLPVTGDNHTPNGFKTKSHEKNWKRIEDFILQSRFPKKSTINNISMRPTRPINDVKDNNNDIVNSFPLETSIRSLPSPAKSNKYLTDDVWPAEKDYDIPYMNRMTNDQCKHHESNDLYNDEYNNTKGIQKWLNEPIADTTQRTVHDTKTPKTKVTPKEEEKNIACTPSISNLLSKPPSGQTTSPTSSVPQSSSDCHSPSVAENNKKCSAMAFTVDFGDSGTSDSSGSFGVNKKLDFSGPISQFAPKHKRNLSVSKVEENKKGEELKIEKPPVGRPRSNTCGASALSTRRGGYHSEGYFSSDQEDESAKKTDTKSPRSHKSAGLPSINRSAETQKSNVLRGRPDSPSNSYTVPLTESANFLIEKMLTATTEIKRKSYGKPEGRTCCKDRKPSVSELTGRLNRSQEKINSPKSDSESSKRNSKSSPTFSDPSKVDDKDDDDASDAGTYTIEKDSPEVEAARNNIGRVFGVITESEAELTSTTAVPNSTTDVALDEESWLSTSETHKPKVVPVISRNSPNWIQQWADSVAEQTKPAMKCMPSRSLVSSPRVQNSNLTPQSSLKDNLDVRPRRKLPTPPQYPSPRSYPKELMYCGDQQSTPKTNPKSSKSFRNYVESQESGGDSDLDFRSYSYTDDERLTAALRDKLRLTGLNASSPKNLPSPRTSPRRFDPLKGTKQSNMMEEVFCGKLSEQSDSSSEAIDPYKEPNRIPDNNPPLKFNRAFSLRRARLACDETPKQVVEKKKTNRPSSAGNIRKVQLSGTRAYQSVDSSSVSSCRSFGCGPVNSVTKCARPFNSVTRPDYLIRNDGGRFSLRLSRSASSSSVKSPSKPNVKRELTPKKSTRSNSTLSPKEIDFQNWKRRKNYDPMKAAADGRKKQTEKVTGKDSEQNGLSSDSPSPHNTLLRSASFHGTNVNDAGIRWTNKLANHLQYTSEEDGPYSLEEEVPLQVTSPLRRSPTSQKQIYSPVLRHHYSQGGSRGFRTPDEHVENNVTPHFQVSQRKVSHDESGSEGKRSPLNSQCSGRGNRPKTKMEALDNLVISTIHSLSVNVRTTAESLLLKLKSQYNEEGERAALLQEVLAHLSESDQNPASQNRSTSRELAGILRNLKKVEHALQVVDRVMVTGAFIDDDDEEDIPNDWGETDY